MLSGLKFVADADEKDKKRKKEKDSKKHGRHEQRSSSSKHKGGKHGAGGDGLVGRKKRRQEWSDPESGDSDGSEGIEEGDIAGTSTILPGDEADTAAAADIPMTREALGLDWMNRAPVSGKQKQTGTDEDDTNKAPQVRQEVAPKSNVREMNPFYADGGDGLPPEGDSDSKPKLPPASSRFGDGGASWRAKALKRARERAAEEGRDVEEVVSERWGLSADALQASARRAAPSHAHRHAIRERTGAGGGKEGGRDKNDSRHGERASRPPEARDSSAGDRRRHRNDEDVEDERRMAQTGPRDYLKDVRGEAKPTMRAPSRNTSLSWKRSTSRTPPPPQQQSDARKSPSPPKEPAKQPDLVDTHPSDSVHIVEEANEVAEPTLAAIAAREEPHLEAAIKDQKQQPMMESVRAQAPTAVPILSANQLAAQAMRARLKGNMEEALRLQAQADALARTEVVQLPLLDAGGRQAVDVMAAATDPSADTDRRQKRLQRYDGEGKQRYYHDDDKDLAALVAETKRSGVDDYDANLADNIARSGRRYKGALNVDDEYEHDAGLEEHESREKKGSKKKQAQRQMTHAINDYKRITTVQDRCAYCFDNANRRKDLIVAIGIKSYLMLPPRGRLVKGHCYILPTQHDVATRDVDEDVWEEMRNFKKCLLRMFASQGKEVIFIETATQLAKQRRHALVECIPMSPGLAREAPLYFKKALDEAEDEWSQHNAKRIIDTGQKGLRGSIPKGFPYFHVEFGLQGGYAHVIDDESSFNAHLGHDVLRGMLELPEEDSHRRPRQQHPDEQKEELKEFLKAWDPVDWTKMLE